MVLEHFQAQSFSELSCGFVLFIQMGSRIRNQSYFPWGSWNERKTELGGFQTFLFFQAVVGPGELGIPYGL